LKKLQGKIAGKWLEKGKGTDTLVIGILIILKEGIYYGKF
jgi:hypothetical protein